jgi:hypothetical protein
MVCLGLERRVSLLAEIPAKGLFFLGCRNRQNFGFYLTDTSVTCVRVSRAVGWLGTPATMAKAFKKVGFRVLARVQPPCG